MADTSPLSPCSRPVDERRVEKALRLIARAAVDTPEAASRAEEELAHWQARSAENAAASHEAHVRWQMLGTLAPDLREHFDSPGATPARPRRRQLLAALLGGGTAGILGSGAWWQRQHAVQFAQDHHNGTLETVLAELPDGPDGSPGSRIQLAPATQLRTTLSRAERSVALTGGEAYFAVASDAARPFRIDTRAGRIEVVGTAFNVSDRSGVLGIAVEHGHVRFTPRPEGMRRFMPFGQATIDLRGGQALTVRGATLHTQTVQASHVAAWRDGWLIFDNTRLDEALPTINAYRHQPIVSGDARVAALRLTGRFRAQDQRELLQALPAILPLRVESQHDGSIRLQAL